MYRLTSKLVIYRNIGKNSILFKLADIFQRFSTGQYVKEDLITEIYDQIHNLLDLSTRYGFDKNLWHNYLAFLLAMSENPFTLVSEKVGTSLQREILPYSNSFLTMIFRLLKKSLESTVSVSC